MSAATHAWRNVYTTRYSGVLRRYHRNEFLARPVTADDRAFLERVVKQGIVGIESYASSYVVEELKFWHMPYTVDHTVKRREGKHGRLPKTVIIPDADEAAYQAQRRQALDTTRAVKQAERKRWELEQEKRRLQQIESDRQWEEALAKETPLARRYRPPSSRHYVPYWKREEVVMEHVAAAQARQEKLRKHQAEVSARLQAKLTRHADKKRKEENKERVRRLVAMQRAEEAEQFAIERIEREALEAARRAWEKEMGIGGELENILEGRQRKGPRQEDE